MAIPMRCVCGQDLQAADEQAGLLVQCPRCGATLSVPAAGAVPPPAPLVQPNYASASTPPAGAMVRAPTYVPDKLRSPGMPPCYMIFSVEHARLNAHFDASAALQDFAEGFAKKARKQFDVQISTSAPDGTAAIYTRLLFVEEGNRWLRYFLALFAGKTILELDGEIRNAAGQRMPFHETHKGSIGIFGGDSLGLLKVSGKYLGGKMAKRLLKMSR
jgi:hypothetical protein